MLGVLNVRLDERIPNIVSELRLDNIWPLFCSKIHQKIFDIVILVYFDGSSAKIWVKYYLSSLL